MKKVIMSLVFVLCMQYVSSQFKGGFNAGVSQFTLNSDVLETKSQISPQFGVHARYILDDKTEVLVELGVNLSKYSVTGTEYEENLLVGSKDYNFKSTSVMVGFYYTYNLIGQNLSVFAGPGFSGNFGNNVLDNVDNMDVRFGDEIEDGFAALRARDVSDISPYLYVSAGISFGLENLKMRLKYDYAISNAYDDVTYDYGGKTLNGKTSFISLALFYSLDLQ